MSKQANIWAAYEGALERFDPYARFLPPEIVAARQQAMQERAEAFEVAQHEAAEAGRRQERHDAYRGVWERARRIELSFHGLDPNDASLLPRSADEVQALADGLFFVGPTAAEVGRAMRKAAEDLAEVGLSGQVTVNVGAPLLPLETRPAPATPLREDGVSPPASPVSASRARILDKLTAFRHRDPATPCTCHACAAVRASS
jgi:hypothetical protein